MGIYLLAFFCPALALPISLFGIRNNFKNWKKYIFLLAIFCAVVAYSYTPVKNEPDIVRYFEWAEVLGKMSLPDALMYQVKGESNLYLLNFLLWIGGKSGDLHIIPAISVFFVYYIFLYITCDAAASEGISSKYVLRYVLFVLLTLDFYSITNNVRNVSGFCIVGLAVYRDLYQGKRNIGTILLYIVPCFLHPSVLLLVLLRLFLLIPGNYKIIFLFLASQVIKITELLYGVFVNITSNNIVVSLVKNLIVKAYWYYRNEESAWAIAVANSGSHQLAKVIYIALAVVMCVSIYLYQRKGSVVDNNGLTERGQKKYIDYVFYIGVVTIACAPMPMPEYWRFVSALIVLAGPVMLPILKSGKTIYSLLGQTIYLFTPIACALWVRQLVKSEIIELLLYPFIMNPVVILLKDLINLIL